MNSRIKNTTANIATVIALLVLVMVGFTYMKIATKAVYNTFDPVVTAGYVTGYPLGTQVNKPCPAGTVATGVEVQQLDAASGTKDVGIFTDIQFRCSAIKVDPVTKKVTLIPGQKNVKVSAATTAAKGPLLTGDCPANEVWVSFNGNDKYDQYLGIYPDGLQLICTKLVVDPVTSFITPDVYANYKAVSPAVVPVIPSATANSRPRPNGFCTWPWVISGFDGWINGGSAVYKNDKLINGFNIICSRIEQGTLNLEVTGAPDASKFTFTATGPDGVAVPYTNNTTLPLPLGSYKLSATDTASGKVYSDADFKCNLVSAGPIDVKLASANKCVIVYVVPAASSSAASSTPASSAPASSAAASSAPASSAASSSTPASVSSVAASSVAASSSTPVVASSTPTLPPSVTVTLPSILMIDALKLNDKTYTIPTSAMVKLSGMAVALADVEIMNGLDPICEATADAKGYWSCEVTLPASAKMELMIEDVTNNLVGKLKALVQYDAKKPTPTPVVATTRTGGNAAPIVALLTVLGSLAYFRLKKKI